MKYTLSEAAAATGKNKATIQRAIKRERNRGKLRIKLTGLIKRTGKMMH